MSDEDHLLEEEEEVELSFLSKEKEGGKEATKVEGSDGCELHDVPMHCLQRGWVCRLIAASNYCTGLRRCRGRLEC